MAIFIAVKFFWSIFAIYILLISILPCGDSHDEHVDKYKTELSANDHSKHNHETESCSPFCHCACCGQTLTFPPGIPLIPKGERPLAFIKANSIFEQRFNATYFANIWQPPQWS